MKLSASVRLTLSFHQYNDSRGDIVFFQALGCPASTIEAVVEHFDYQNERVCNILRNGLGIEPRLAEAIILLMWRSMIGGPHFMLASEILRQISDLRPILQKSFYSADALRIERQMRSFQPVAVEGPDVLTTVVD